MVDNFSGRSSSFPSFTKSRLCSFVSFSTGITQTNTYLLLTPNTLYHPTYQDWRPCWPQRLAYHKGSNSPTHLPCDATDHTRSSRDPGVYTWLSYEPRRLYPCHMGGGGTAHSIVCVPACVSYRSYPLGPNTRSQWAILEKTSQKPTGTQQPTKEWENWVGQALHSWT